MGKSCIHCDTNGMDPRPKILLVDDDPAITTNLAPILERAGYIVSVAQDGEETLRTVAGLAPNLIILDVRFPKPGLDGREVLRRLRSDGNLTPVILLSEVVGPDERAEALGNEGADDYLNKPFTTGELIARIKTVLRRVDAGCSGHGVQAYSVRQTQRLSFGLASNSVAGQIRLGGD